MEFLTLMGFDGFRLEVGWGILARIPATSPTCKKEGDRFSYNFPVENKTAARGELF